MALRISYHNRRHCDERRQDGQWPEQPSIAARWQYSVFTISGMGRGGNFSFFVGIFEISLAAISANNRSPPNRVFAGAKPSLPGLFSYYKLLPFSSHTPD
jgi:hypothetical protein